MPAGTNVTSGNLVSPGGQQGIPGPGIPPGIIWETGSSTAPSGWLLCDGTSYPTATYPALFTAIGYAFGGAGANFNVPDCRGRASIGAGQGTGLTNRALGMADGAETHTLSVAELAAHSHVLNDPTHYHPIQMTINYGYGPGSYGAEYYAAGGVTTDSQSTGVTAQNTGSGTPLPIMNPFLALNKIIKF